MVRPNRGGNVMLWVLFILLAPVACRSEDPEAKSFDVTSCAFRSAGFTEHEGKLYADVVVYSRDGFVLAEIGDLRIAVPHGEQIHGFSQSAVLVSPPRSIDEEFTIPVGGNPARQVTFTFTSDQINVTFAGISFKITNDGFWFGGDVFRVSDGPTLIEYDAVGKVQRVMRLECGGDHR